MNQRKKERLRNEKIVDGAKEIYSHTIPYTLDT